MCYVSILSWYEWYLTILGLVANRGWSTILNFEFLNLNFEFEFKIQELRIFSSTCMLQVAAKVQNYLQNLSLDMATYPKAVV